MEGFEQKCWNFSVLAIKSQVLHKVIVLMFQLLLSLFIYCKNKSSEFKIWYDVYKQTYHILWNINVMISNKNLFNLVAINAKHQVQETIMYVM